MKLKTIRVENFLCFGQTEWSFDAGVWRVVGENRDSASADSNGAGKSSMHDALQWCLFGKVLKRLKSDEVIRRGSDFCSVVLLFSVRGQDYRIRRYRNHPDWKNALFLESANSPECDEWLDIRGKDTKDTQEAINDLLGVSMVMFELLTVMGPTGVTQFSSMSDSQRKKLFEQILNLDVYEKAAALCRQKKKESDAQRERAQDHADLMAQHMRDLSKYHDEMIESYHREQESLRVEMEGVREQEAKNKELLREQEDVLHGIHTQISDYEKQKEEIGERLKQYEETERKKTNLKQAILLKENDKSVAALEIERWQEKLDTSLHSENCHSCGQRLPEEKIKENVDEARSRVEQWGEWHQKAVQEVEGLEEELSALECTKNFSETLQQHLDVGSAITSLQNLKTEVVKTMKSLQDQSFLTASLESRMERVAQNIREWEEKKAEKAKSNMQAIEKSRQEVDLCATLSKQYSVLASVFGAKGIRSYLFESALPYLNERLNTYLAIMSEETLQASISATTENAKGEIRETIDMVIHTPSGQATYDSCSAGEKRRLDVPVALAIQDLASRFSVQVPYVCMDEVFANLDESGANGIKKLLRKLEKLRPETTWWVISHDHHKVDWIPQELRVVKEGNQTKVMRG